jgi:arginyl-tRNA synthetase
LSFQAFVSESKEIILTSVESLGYPPPKDLEWAEPREKDYGDLSFRIGFQLAKQLGKRPAEVAKVISDEISRLGVVHKYVGKVEAHPSGFLNFWINKELFFSNVIWQAQQSDYGKNDFGEGRRVLVEHTSANPSGALHIGHLRNLVIGDSLARIFSFAGYETNVLNYIDDSGLQVASVILGMKYLGFSEDAPYGVKYDHYTHDPVYVSAVKKVEEDVSLKDKQAFILKEIEEGQGDIAELVARVTDKILKEQLKTCWRFGAFYDLLVYESDIVKSKLWEELFENLKKKGIARYETEGKLAGCWIVSVKGESEGEEKVLVRSNGTATYVAKDTPFAALKMGLIEDRFSYSKYAKQPNGSQLWRTVSDQGETKVSPVSWNPSRALTPIDDRQARLQRIIQFILGQIAGKSMEDRYIHVGYAIVSLSPKTAESLGVQVSEPSSSEKKVITMKARRGLVVIVDDALEAVKKRALEETLRRNPESKGTKWAEDVAEKIAVAALRFTLLKQDLDKIIVFDLEESLRLVGETGPYLLYTYARASSIVAKSVDGDTTKGIPETEGSGSFLKQQSEDELVMMLSKFGISVEKSIRMIAPKWIAHYSYELCEAFNKFYEENRVLQEKDEKMRAARLALVRATRNVLRQSLSLLGIEALDKI